MVSQTILLLKAKEMTILKEILFKVRINRILKGINKRIDGRHTMSDNSKTRVVVGMSGGVDSSVTALCLQYLLHHLYLLKNHQLTLLKKVIHFQKSLKLITQLLRQKK